jgi:hypothetical protein
MKLIRDAGGSKNQLKILAGGERLLQGRAAKRYATKVRRTHKMTSRLAMAMEGAAGAKARPPMQGLEKSVKLSNSTARGSGEQGRPRMSEELGCRASNRRRSDSRWTKLHRSEVRSSIRDEGACQPSAASQKGGLRKANSAEPKGRPVFDRGGKGEY